MSKQINSQEFCCSFLTEKIGFSRLMVDSYCILLFLLLFFNEKINLVFEMYNQKWMKATTKHTHTHSYGMLANAQIVLCNMLNCCYLVAVFVVVVVVVVIVVFF